MKNLLLFFVYLGSTKYAHSLDCYVTDLDALDAGDINARPIIQNCKYFLEKESMNIAITPDIEDDLRCYTVQIDSDRANIGIQGCAPQNSCGILTDEMKSMEWQFVSKNIHFRNVSCTDCEGDLCNGGITRTIVVKNSYNIKYIIIISFIAVMILISAISVARRHCSKKSFRAEKNYTQLLV